MVKSVQSATEYLTEYIQEHEKDYKKWYVGVAEKARKRLFEEHKVLEKGGSWWTYTTCSTDNESREVEEKMIKIGCDGAPGGGSVSSIQVYVYHKTNETAP